MSFEHFARRWTYTLSSHSHEQKDVWPSYWIGENYNDGLIHPITHSRGKAQRDTKTPLMAARNMLITQSNLHSFDIGTGGAIYTRTLLPALLTAKEEIVLVTCFWRKDSHTREAISTALAELSRRRQIVESCHNGSTGIGKKKLQVKIGLSSVSLFQRLFHTSSRQGFTYPPEHWAPKLGLPDPEVLAKGEIDMTVKSLFFNPLSVLHPKYVVIDRKVVFFPSCNVSWESWLEGCLVLSGVEAVKSVMRFHDEVWDFGRNGQEDDFGEDMGDVGNGEDQTDQGEVGGFGLKQKKENMKKGEEKDVFNLQRARESYVNSSPVLMRITNSSLPNLEHSFMDTSSPKKSASNEHSDNPFESTLSVSTIILPSPHHLNPRFHPFPWQKSPSPPPTPLNLAILELLAGAERSIFLQSPNFTCAAVLDAVLDALNRGVDVRIIAGGRNMMVLEQVITAGTTTRRCLRRLVRKYEKLGRERMKSGSRNTANSADNIVDVEAGIPVLGQLSIGVFVPKLPSCKAAAGADTQLNIEQGERKKVVEENPTYAHLKLTIIDDTFVVLGSGNMDRASFFTSQELGILLNGAKAVDGVRRVVEKVLEGRIEEWVF